MISFKKPHLLAAIAASLALSLTTSVQGQTPAQSPPSKPPAVLLLGQEANWPVCAKIAGDTGINFGARGFGDLTWEKLSKFNAVILFDMSRLNPDTREVNQVEMSPEGFKRVSELLARFVNEGGGLYVYGVSFTHMGQEWSSNTLNQFLEPFDAKIAFERLNDPPREARQEGGQKVLYAQAATIANHPATAGVKNWWYAAGTFSYGPWTRALKLGPEWTPLIRTSDQFKSTPVKEWDQPLEGVSSIITDKTAAIYAARTQGKGRIILNGGESTISFFGYNYSPHADRMWGRISMEAGLNGVKSDGLKLMESSLAWLTEPSLQSGIFGGYTPPRMKTFTPKTAGPLKWSPPVPTNREIKYYKGVFCGVPALGGGFGTVAEWAAAAKAYNLDYLVLAGDFAKMDKPAWDKLVEECKAATTAEFVVTPALITKDDQDNSFLQCGNKSWPKDERLSKKDPKRVQDHQNYWMTDANFPLRALFLFSKGQYPAWLHSGYDTFAVRTYEGDKLVEDQLPGFLQNQEQGDRSRIITMTLLTKPSELAAVKEFTYVTSRDFVASQFNGGSMSYVSTGPGVLNWSVAPAVRDTFGEYYVPGTERWRANLRVTSEKPLKSVTIYDSTGVFRRFAVSGNSCDLNFDGLHDTRHVLTAVIEDEAGGRAVTGAIEIQDSLFIQGFCSDRANIMGGSSTIRHTDGKEEIVSATSMLYKAGRLVVGTISKREELPGIDGSGGQTAFFWNPTFFMTATAPEKSEERSLLHKINRPYESAECIIFDTPILKRSEAPNAEIFGHNPYVDLVDPKVEARLVQYHFYRKPTYPSPVMGEFSMTVTDPDGVELKQGWNGFSQRYAETYGDIKRYAIVRADGTREEGPSADETTGTNWRGELHPGDSVYLSDQGEGMYLLEGDLSLVIECEPSRKWFRIYCGRFDTPQLPKGSRSFVRFVNFKLEDKGDNTFAEWERLKDLYGIAGGKPAYAVTATQGSVTSTRYLLELAADQYGFAGTIDASRLPQSLPVKVTGLNPKWTAARVDLERKQWFPLGVWDGAAYMALDPALGEQKLFIGNLVAADNPDVFLTLLPANADGTTHVEAHNPTEKEVTTKVNVPVATFLAGKQEQTVTIPPGESVTVELTQ